MPYTGDLARRWESAVKSFQRLKPLFYIFLAVIFLAPGCALRSQSSASPSPVASVAPSTAPRCSDRVDRARTGSLVGSVLGTIAASVIGSPFLGVFYKTAGYVMGFASDNPCPRTNLPKEAKNDSTEKAGPSTSPTIGEEDL